MRRLLRRLGYLLHKRRREDELAEELAFHRDMTGDPRAFGSGALAQNQARDVWIPVWLQDLAQDVRFGVRVLGQDRRFTLAAVLALALGIAATNTVFVLINTALFKDLPFDHPRQIVSVTTRDTHGRTSGISYADFRDWQREARAFSLLSASSQTATNVGDADRAPERYRGVYASGNLFALLRVAPMLGRTLVADDDHEGAAPVVVLGEDVWRSRYAGDPSILGHVLRVNDVWSTVVGVMPARFAFPGTAELWMPLTMLPGLREQPRDARMLTVTGRLADGVTLAQTRANIDAIANRLADAYPATNRDFSPHIAPPLEDIRRFTLPYLMTLFAAVLFVLVIACSNVAMLLLARAAHRGREIAVRASLGATRWRIVRQLLAESVLLAAIAGMVGLVLSLYGTRYFGTAFDQREVAAPERLARPYWIDLTFDAHVFMFVALVCLGASIVFGLAPAWHLSTINTHDVLKDSSSSATSVRAVRWTSPLMVLELALSLVLLSSAGLLARNYLAVYQTDLVIDISHLTTARLALTAKPYATPDVRKAFLDKLESALSTGSPGIEATTLATDVPLVTLGGSAREVSVEGESTPPGGRKPRANYVAVGIDYLRTIGLPLQEGRTFSTRDSTQEQVVAVVNRAFASHFFAGTNAVGHRVQLTLAGTAGRPDLRGPWVTIVGIVPTLPVNGPRDIALEPTVYVPLALDPSAARFVSIITRAADPRIATAFMRDRVRALDDSLTLYSVQTVADGLDQTRVGPRLVLSFFSTIAGIALAIALVGLFGLTAHGVAQRTREIGVRMALGARQGQIMWLFLRRTIRQLAIGSVLGLAGALAAGRVLQSLLDRVTPHDPVTLIGIVVLLAAVALIASVLPARRATEIDPAAALRHD
jgi:predicted permease